MIQRPENLITVLVYLRFNSFVFDKIEIDLKHINKNGRSKFTKDEVFKILYNLINNIDADPVDIKIYGHYTCTYYAIKGCFENKFFKIILCICDDRPNSIGVITLYRIGESK